MSSEETPVANERLDVSRLAAVVERCFDYALDGRLTAARRRGFLIAGKRLRGCLLNLISARFDDTTALDQANGRLVEVNGRLADVEDTIDHTASVLGDVTKLASALDTLVGAAATFL
jgi:hypothetical protein